jgi:flagellar hook-associated protein 3 FlgL
MRISTNEFMLGSLADLMQQQNNINQLNREIATGQTMLDAADDPGGAGQVVGLANQVGTLAYDAANGQAARATLQSGVSALQQVSTLLVQLRQSAIAAANGGTSQADRQSDITGAQSLLQQLVQLANIQGAHGGYLFAGSRSNTQAFSQLPNGQVVFNGDADSNQVTIAPSLDVTASISGQGIFTNIPAGTAGIAVTAAGGNSGGAYALAQGVANQPQVTAAALAGTEYDINFSGSGSSLTYQVTSGHGAPGSAGYTATSGVVASGSYAAGSGLAFGGMELQVNGTPAA